MNRIFFHHLLEKRAAKERHQRWQEYMVLGIAIVVLATLAAFLHPHNFLAQSTPSTFTAPPIFGPGFDDCNLGFIDACNDSEHYVAGPESILDTWFFSDAIPWWVSFFLVLGSGVAVLMIMAGGVMVTVGADSDVRKRGVKTIIWAIVGIVIALFAFTIVGIIENIPFPGSTAPSQ